MIQGINSNYHYYENTQNQGKMTQPSSNVAQNISYKGNPSFKKGDSFEISGTKDNKGLKITLGILASAALIFVGCKCFKGKTLGKGNKDLISQAKEEIVKDTEKLEKAMQENKKVEEQITGIKQAIAEGNCTTVEEVQRNLDVSNVSNGNTRRMVEDAVRNEPTEKDVQNYLESIAPEKLTQEQEIALAEINASIKPNTVRNNMTGVTEKDLRKAVKPKKPVKLNESKTFTYKTSGNEYLVEVNPKGEITCVMDQQCKIMEEKSLAKFLWKHDSELNAIINDLA